MKLCTNLCECNLNIRLEENWQTPPLVWITSYSPSSIHVPLLRRLEIHGDHFFDGAHVYGEFLRPLAMPNVKRFNFSLQEEPNTELAVIANGLSRPDLEFTLLYTGEGIGLTDVTSALLVVTFLTAPGCVLPTSTIQITAQKDHLPMLTSLDILDISIGYADMDVFIGMLRTRWVNGIKARQPGCSTPGIIQSARIYIANAPGTWIGVSRKSTCVSCAQHKHRYIGKETGVISSFVPISKRRKHVAPRKALTLELGMRGSSSDASRTASSTGKESEGKERNSWNDSSKTNSDNSMILLD